MLQIFSLIVFQELLEDVISAENEGAYLVLGFSTGTRIQFIIRFQVTLSMTSTTTIAVEYAFDLPKSFCITSL